MDKQPDNDLQPFAWHRHPMRRLAVVFLIGVEDFLYVVLSTLLIGVALWILAGLFASLTHAAEEPAIVLILDRLLLVLMVAELLHTLLLFLRTHHFRHEPFLVIGIIAGVRRILILTAQASARSGGLSHDYLLELGVTTLVVLVFAIALRIGSSRPF